MSNPGAIGIIFPNIHDQNIPELVEHRAMGSIPFAGRYRMIDFCLSGMVQAGVQSVGVLTQKNYQSLMDHLGNGREWDLSTKRGGLVIYPPYARDGEVYSGRLQALASILPYLASRREEYVVMSDCDIAFNLDYQDLLAHHRESGANITMVYEKANLRDGMRKDNVCLTFGNDGRVREIRVNEYRKGARNLSMGVFVMGREFLADAVHEAMVRGENDFTRDFLVPSLKRIRVHGYPFGGYSARIFDMQSYFRESLRLLEPENLSQLFPHQRPVYTKVRDEAPVRYAIGSHTIKSLVADGCIIEGAVENCVIFREARVGKGARLKNCVIMQGTVVEPDAVLENVITDKDVTVKAGQRLQGAPNFPVYVAKGRTVL